MSAQYISKNVRCTSSALVLGKYRYYQAFFGEPCSMNSERNKTECKVDVSGVEAIL